MRLLTTEQVMPAVSAALLKEPQSTIRANRIRSLAYSCVGSIGGCFPRPGVTASVNPQVQESIVDDNMRIVIDITFWPLTMPAISIFQGKGFSWSCYGWFTANIAGRLWR
ncbi:hypothetical protein D3C72_1284290 [compost metagenome]